MLSIEEVSLIFVKNPAVPNLNVLIKSKLLLFKEKEHRSRAMAGSRPSRRSGSKGQQLPDGRGAFFPHLFEEPLRGQETQEGRDSETGEKTKQGDHMGRERVS